MKDEYLFCKAPLEYLEADILMDSIIGLCMSESSKDPIVVIEKI